MEPGYPGEALVRLTGVVPEAAKLEDEELAGLEWELTWVNFLIPGTMSDADQLGAEGQFPNRFVLEVLNRPAGKLLNDFTDGGRRPLEARIGVALIDSQHWFSYSRQVLAYVESDVVADTVSARFVGGRLRAGFHLLEAVDAPCDTYLPPDDPLEGQLDCLRPASGDLDGIVELRTDELEGVQYPPDYPNFYPEDGIRDEPMNGDDD
ncbi:MAG TPA: hypothetical protein VK698_37500 [Kofleriaceae bacterium]|nr:hypothetical protein [Kofleriaceae bacterium]